MSQTIIRGLKMIAILGMMTEIKGETMTPNTFQKIDDRNYSEYRPVVWDDIQKHPEAFERVRVAYTGVYEHAFESENLDGQVWLERAEDVAYSPAGSHLPTSLVPPANQIGVRVFGILHTQKGSYGHLGSYPYLLHAQRIEILDVSLNVQARVADGALQVSYALTNHSGQTLVVYDGATGIGGGDYPDLTGQCYVSYAGDGLVRVFRDRTAPHPTVDTTRIFMPAVSEVKPGETRRVSFRLTVPLKERSEWTPDYPEAAYKKKQAKRLELQIGYFLKTDQTVLKPLGHPNVWLVVSGAALSGTRQISRAVDVSFDILERTDDTFIRTEPQSGKGK